MGWRDDSSIRFFQFFPKNAPLFFFFGGKEKKGKKFLLIEVLPYQRPPLSKVYLKNPQEVLQPHRAEAARHLP